jgi:hypothetical protein
MTHRKPLPVVDERTVVTLLGDIAADRPDYIHEPDPVSGCYLYLDADGTGPGCIVGHVLTRLGATVEFLAAREGVRADHVAAAMRGMDLTDVSWDVLLRAQDLQDAGKSWGAVAADAARRLTR